MASVKVKFKPSTLVNGEGTIFYQIIHKRKVRRLFSDYHVFPSEWDDKRCNVVRSSNADRSRHIINLRRCIGCDVERLKRIILHLDYQGIDYQCEDVIAEFNNFCDEYSLYNFIEELIERMKQGGRSSTAENYRSTINSFKKFRQYEDILLDAINSDIIESYESWLRGNGVTRNTTSFYMRILRAVYNRVVEDEIIKDKKPFRRVCTNVEKTVKKALSFNLIKQISQMDLTHAPKVDYARDMFMMSFYLRGMSFVDMAYLKKTDLADGVIVYRRRKTGQQLTIAWMPEMQKLLDRYPDNESEYLLPIICSPCYDTRKKYKNVAYNINYSLKKIAGMIGLTIPLTLYVARHSWATAARQSGASISVISEALGHESEATTQIYLASLDTSAVNETNARIIRKLSK